MSGAPRASRTTRNSIPAWSVPSPSASTRSNSRRVSRLLLSHSWVDNSRADRLAIAKSRLDCVCVRAQAAAPLPHRIPSSDLIGVTVILLTCSYNDQEFVRIGYYVNTEYGDPDLKLQHEASLAEDADEKGIKAPDPTQHIDKLVRNVLADKPRVTKFNIQWCASLSLPLSPGLSSRKFQALTRAFLKCRDTPAVSAVPTMSSATTGAIGSEAMAGAPAAAAPPPPFNPYQAAA